jgi:ABC-type multidrug transport system permease subunit
MPSWMRLIIYVFPQHYSAKIYRWSIIKDLGISDLLIEFTVLTAIAIVFFVLSLLFIKKNFESK